MIQFRCWYCNHRYSKAEADIGKQFVCSCDRSLRVPKHDDGNCRVKSIVDRIVEILVFGVGSGLLGFGVGILIMMPFGAMGMIELSVVGVFTLIGFLAGFFGGERGMNWIGRMVRDSSNMR